jgi:hypothetical protein
LVPNWFALKMGVMSVDRTYRDGHQGQSALSGSEAAARDALHERMGRIMDRAQWAAARHNLLECAQILRAWEQRRPTNPKRETALDREPKAA